MSAQSTLSGSGGRIFINYRRDDDPGFTQAIFQRLEQAFSVEQLFMDVEDYIKAGDDFARVLRDQITRCDILLVVIGPRWLTARDRTGALRLENPTDFVRNEIVWALQLNKYVMPVLVGGAEMPRPDQLPETIRSLSYRHALRLTPERFKVDTDGLISKVEEALGQIRVGREIRTQIESKILTVFKSDDTRGRQSSRAPRAHNDPPIIMDCSSIERLVHSDLLVAVSIIVEYGAPDAHAHLAGLLSKDGIVACRNSLNLLLNVGKLDPSQRAWCYRCLGALSYFANADPYSRTTLISYAKAKELDSSNAAHWFALGLWQREHYSSGAERSFERFLQLASLETNPEEVFWAHIFLSEIAKSKPRIYGPEEHRQTTELDEQVRQHLAFAISVTEQRITAGSDSTLWTQRACIALNQLGMDDRARDAGGAGRSLANYRAAVQKLQNLDSQGELEQPWKYFESAILNRIGHVLRRAGDWPGSIDHFRSAKHIREQMMADGGTSGPALRAIARTWSYIAGTQEAADEREKAIQAREEAIRTLNHALAIKPDDPESIMELARELWALAKMGVDAEKNLRDISSMLRALEQKDQIDGHSSELLMIVDGQLKSDARDATKLPE